MDKYTEEIPTIGQYVIMTIGNKIEKMEVVFLLKDKINKNITHVFFSSNIPENNIHIVDGIPFYYMITYNIPNNITMKDEFLFKTKSYCKAVPVASGTADTINEAFTPFVKMNILDKGSDCKTDRTVKIIVGVGLYRETNSLLYKYIVEDGKIVELIPDNISQYIGKTVNMRAAFLCEAADGVCNACAGNTIYRFEELLSNVNNKE
jgi:hypothetical protein